MHNNYLLELMKELEFVPSDDFYSIKIPSAPGPRACLMHPTWAGHLFHPRYYTCFDAVLLKHPTLAGGEGGGRGDRDGEHM